MEKNHAIAAFAALSQETRLDILRLLIRAGRNGLLAGELAAALDVRANTLSANLAVLDQAGLVAKQRMGRNIRYFALTETVSQLVGYLMEDCCGGNPDLCAPVLHDIATANQKEPVMAIDAPKDVYNVLFLCTGNSARSILAEAILNREGKGKFRAYSAGSHPAGQVHPYAIDLLKGLNHPTDALRSKDWEEFAGPDAPKLDFVFTVCDKAAAEPCPIWPGQPMSAHWGLPDPAAFEGAEAEKRAVFLKTYRMLRSRISIFANLPMTTLDQLSLQERLDDIGQSKAEA